MSTKYKLLIVDDEPEICEILVDILSDYFDCSTATSYKDALALSKVVAFDGLLCDYQMPGNSGIDLVTIMLHRNKNLVAAIVTGSIDVDFGSLQVFHKPFNEKEIIAYFSKWLSRKDY